jgi:hypothetical protein
LKVITVHFDEGKLSSVSAASILDKGLKVAVTFLSESRTQAVRENALRSVEKNGKIVAGPYLQDDRTNTSSPVMPRTKVF